MTVLLNSLNALFFELRKGSNEKASISSGVALPDLADKRVYFASWGQQKNNNHAVPSFCICHCFTQSNRNPNTAEGIRNRF